MFAISGATPGGWMGAAVYPRASVDAIGSSAAVQEVGTTVPEHDVSTVGCTARVTTGSGVAPQGVISGPTPEHI
jgi:hypothetical protein